MFNGAVEQRITPLVCFVVVVLAALSATPAEATFPGRNGVIVVYRGFGVREGQQTTRIFTVDPRTGRGRTLRTCISANPFGLREDSGCWLMEAVASPDGRELVFGTFDDSHKWIRSPDGGGARASQPSVPYVGYMDLSGGSFRRFPTRRELFTYAWAPDGRTLLAVRMHRANDLVMTRLDGSVTHVVAAGPFKSPTLSKSGAIAYVREAACGVAPACKGDRILAARRGGAPRTVAFGRRPSWSPDGRRIVFEGAVLGTGRSEVFTVRADGRGLRRLTFKGGETPVWSPDGKRIAFTRHFETDTSDYLNINTMTPDGRRLRRLRSCYFYCRISDWQALPRRSR